MSKWLNPTKPQPSHPKRDGPAFPSGCCCAGAISSDTRLPVEQTLVVRSTPFFLEPCRLPGKLQDVGHTRSRLQQVEPLLLWKLADFELLGCRVWQAGVCYGWEATLLD